MAPPFQPPPLDNTYWVEPGRLLAGEYPGAGSEQAARARIRKLLDAGVACFIDLTAPGELEPYDPLAAGSLRPRRGVLPAQANPGSLAA